MALEPEQIEKEINIDKLQKLWDEYKRIVVTTIVIIITAYIAFQFYLSSVKKSNEVASQIYQEIIMENIDNTDVIKAGVAILKENHSSTPYSSRGAIFLSRSLVNKNMNDEAIIELVWAAKNAAIKA